MYRYCFYCGAVLPEKCFFPHTCTSCHNTLYRNPIPVGVALLPVDSGLLVIQRGLKDGYKKWALPGGFLEVHETWQQGILRELYEETGILLTKDTPVSIFDLQSDSKGNLLIFAKLPSISQSQLPSMQENNEVLSMRIIYQPEPLAFPIHEQVVKKYFGDCN